MWTTAFRAIYRNRILFFDLSHMQMEHWTESLDAIPLDLLSKQEKAKIEALVRFKVLEPDPSLFRGDSGTVSTRLKELLQLQGTGAAITHIIFPTTQNMS